MAWIYQNEPLTEIPEGYQAFVYVITCEPTGRKYVGKKLAKFSRTKYKTVTLKNGTKKKKKIRDKIDSDWQEYYGSSNELNKDIELLGKEHFRRDILFYCKTKAECSYIEAREQFARQVLESDDYYNNNIMCRIHGSHIRGKL